MQTGTNTNADPPLRAVRIAQGLSLRQAAARAAIDPAQLSRVERGRGHLTIAGLYRLAGVLELRELQRLLRPYVSETPKHEAAA